MIANVECKLYIKIASAKDLPAMDYMTSSSDPYVIILVDGEKKDRTRTIYKTLNPDWLEEFMIDIEKHSHDLVFKLYDAEHIPPDEFIGEVVFDILDLKDGTETDNWFSILPRNKARVIGGKLRIKVGYYVSKFTKHIGIISISIVELLNTFGNYCKVSFTNDVNPDHNRSFKTKNVKQIPKWGENFEYQVQSSDIEHITVTISVCITKSKRGKKTKHIVGQYVVPLMQLICSHENMETRQIDIKLYPAQPKDNKLGQLRSTIRYIEKMVFPVEVYSDLVDMLVHEDRCLINLIYDICPRVSDRKMIFAPILAILENENKAVDFINYCNTVEVENTIDAATIFRANSMASIAMEAYLIHAGKSILFDVLEVELSELYSSSKSCELDPNRIQVKETKKNFNFLTQCVTNIWNNIINNSGDIPSNIRLMFHHLQSEVTTKWPNNEDVKYLAPGGFIFLRFFCAAILSPNLFNLVGGETPTKLTPRNLLLISKVLMNLANLCHFGAKEPYMDVMNEFIDDAIPQFKLYIDEISKPSSTDVPVVVNLNFGSEVASVQGFLLSNLDNIKEIDEEQYPIKEELLIVLEVLEKLKNEQIERDETERKKRIERTSSLIFGKKHKRPLSGERETQSSPVFSTDHRSEHESGKLRKHALIQRG
eukprot:TRINITY_DN5928_c0_g1_i2.p1 TRINITY_DN5928_c0_g1~~TRINITY_DN5928_c0_g1_i2.p1  ORF type:complete len:653 (-),score=108.44 TRINITY_DN5928_c0_g1_i2:45-2003(-)